MARELPYGAFNFRVNLNGQPNSYQGGFSDVSGLGTEFLVAEYRNGNDSENHVRKVVGLHKVSDVTLKRGLIDEKSINAWINDVRTKGSAAARDIAIELYDESNKRVRQWKLRRAVPMKYTAPTLAAKAHGDVAMEELTLACEGLDLET